MWYTQTKSEDKIKAEQTYEDVYATHLGPLPTVSFNAKQFLIINDSPS